MVGTCLAIQWLSFCTSTAGGMGLIPRWEPRCHKPYGVAKGGKKGNGTLGNTK